MSVDSPPGSPSLPPFMVGRPFGFDEAGRPINRNKGVTIVATVRHMLDYVGQRAAQALPPGTGDAERTACIAQAQEAAFNRLIERLNAAIPDPRYHVTRDYLLNEGNSYSVEFDAFISEMCRDISGDPRFHFNRGTKGLPASLLSLARPFSLRQVYSLLPRFAARVADTDLRVVQVGPNSATVRWYSAKERAMLPPALHRLFIEYSCQYIQGSLASIPPVHSGLPMADVRETGCQLKGDEYCEWEFTWQVPQARPQAGFLRGLFAPRSKTGLAGGLDQAALAAASPATPPLGEDKLPPRPAHMAGQPFGADPAGRLIRDASGTLLLAVIEQMQAYVGQRVERGLPAGLDATERAARIAQAQVEALDQLVERLNAAIPDRDYHVSGDYLLDTSHYYSHEFNLFANEIAYDISGDPYLFFRRGFKSVPASLVHMTRPLPLSSVYNLVPRLSAKVSDADIRVVRVSSNSAVLQWHPGRQMDRLPANLHKRYMRMACQTYQGVFAIVPALHSGLPLATISETRCLLRGDAYCEWEFTWQPVKRTLGLALWVGAGLSLVLLAFILLRLPGWGGLAIAAALLPLAVGWLVYALSVSESERARQERLLHEQRDRFEEQYDAWQQAHVDLQLSNIALQHRLSELTTLHEVGQALSATLDLNELLDRSLSVVTSRLGFDRALIMLMDEERGVLSGGRAIGGTPEIAAQVAHMEFSLTDPHGLAAQVVRSGKPVLVDDPGKITRPTDRAYLEALGTSACLLVPLMVKGRVVGLLAVDNALTGRAIPEAVQDLLFTVGSQIASAVDSARLYQTLEWRVEQRTAELERRAVQLQTAAEISRAASSVLDLPALLQQSVDLINERFGLYYVGLFLVDEGRQFAWLRAGTGQAGAAMLARENRLAVDETSMIGWCVCNARARIALDVGQEAVRFDNPHLPHTRSEMALPLITSGQVIGALSVQSDQPQAFGEADTTVLQTMADQLANAIGNARLYAAVQQELAERKRAETALGESQRRLEAAYQRELAVARQLQASLLPASAPLLPGLDIAGFSQAAHYVGGDFYNYFVFDADHLGIAVGDVSGHGLQAALLMALSFGLLANQVRREVLPAALLADMNGYIRPHTLRSKLNTALCYLTLEHVDGSWMLRVANAGVITPLLRSRQGRVAWLDTGGLPLGALSGTSYAELVQALSPGDVLLLSSDGVVEAKNAAGELYSFERLEARLANAPAGSALDIRDWILADVRAFTGGAELQDDLTLVTVVLGVV